MQLKKNRKILGWYLAALLFALSFRTAPAHAASAAGHYGAAVKLSAAEREEAAEDLENPLQEDPDFSLDLPGEASSAEELPDEEMPKETESLKEPETSAGPQSPEQSEEQSEHHTEEGTETEPAEEPVSENAETEASETQEEDTAAETLPETEDTAAETELSSEKVSESSETILTTEELTTETELAGNAQETLSLEETEFTETESEKESETEELTIDHSMLFDLLESWWESMQLAFVTKILQLILAFLLFFVGRRLINTFIRIMDRVAEHKGWDPTVCSFARNAARAILYLALAMVILTCVGVEVASLAAIISSIGVALGLALQGSLSNLAGGLLLAIMKPIHLGDFINASGYSGTVSEIGLVYTTLVGADDRTVVIPNSTLMSSVIENYSKQTTRRVEVQCPISYDANLKFAMNIFRDVLMSIPERLPDKPVNVFVATLGDSGVVLEGQIYVEWTHYLAALWAVKEKIKLSFDDAGIEIPLPQIVVSRKQENQE